MEQSHDPQHSPSPHRRRSGHFYARRTRRPGQPIKCFADYAEAAAYYDTLPKGRDITNLRTVCTFRPRGTMMAV